jgi:hypothetical protein
MTLKIIKSDEEVVAQQAIEFWATIAEIEQVDRGIFPSASTPPVVCFCL